MRTKRRTYRLSGGRRNLTQKAGGRKHRKKNPKGKKKKKKNSKKRPQKQSKVTLNEYDALQEVMLKRSEALPKPLEKVNIFNNNAITQKVIGKYMYGPGYQTEEELEDEEEELLHKLNQFKTEYKELDKPYDDYLFKWGEKYSTPGELDTQQDQIKKTLQFKNKNIKALTDIQNKKKQQQKLLTKRGLYKGDDNMDDDIMDDDNIRLFNEASNYLNNPNDYERKLSDLYDLDLGMDDNYWTRLAKHHQELPPKLYPITEEDNESVYGKEEDLRYYHPPKTVNEMTSHYNTHKEILPQIKENMKYYEDKLDTFHKKEQLYSIPDLNISLCNKIKHLTLTDPKLYQDTQFKDKYITPCSDNKLLTEVYINTFYTTPHPLKNYFLEGSVRKEIMRGDGEIILLPHSITDILDNVPNKYLPEWAKIDVFHFIIDVLELPEDLQRLSRHFSENKNLEDFLDKLEDHLTKVVYIDVDGIELGFNYALSIGESIGWTKDKIKEKQEQYRFVKLTEEQINSGVVSWLTMNPEMSDEEVSRINKTLHHPDFDIEKTKRYLILLLMGLVQNESFKQANHSNLSKLVNRMENIVEAELGIETPWLFPHVLPIDLDDLSYQQILEEVLDYNPPLKNEKAIDLYIRKKMSFRLYKDYYDLYQYFNNKLYPDGMPDSSPRSRRTGWSDDPFWML